MPEFSNHLNLNGSLWKLCTLCATRTMPVDTSSREKRLLFSSVGLQI